MNKNKQILYLLYTIIMVLIFTLNYVDYSPSYSLQIILGLVIVFISFIMVKYNKNNKKLVKDIFKIFLIPALLIHLYTIIGMILGFMDSTYFSTNLSKYIPILVSMSLILTCGKDAFKICVNSFFLSWTLSVVLALIFRGIGILPFAIMSGYFGVFDPILGVSKNYFEIHDIVLSVGLLIIYFYFINDKLYKKDFATLLFYLLIMFLGIKRIALLGVFVVLFFIKLTKNKKFKYKKTFLNCISALLIAFSFLYLYIIFKLGILEDISNKFDINLMGRNYYYNTIVKYGKFSGSYLGIGRNAVTKVLASKYSYLKVTGVHNDILKMYIENGFIVFSLWLIYFVYILPKHFYKKYGAKVAYLSMALTIYSVIVFTTDNVENYFIFQLFNIIIIYDYIMKNNLNKIEKN